MRLHSVEVKNPTDYARIFTVVDEQLREITGRHGENRPILCVHLSPGTPAMTAIWLLLGKTRYPAIFYQTHQGKAWETEIPFDLTVDFVPELLRKPDEHLQHLAARSPRQVAGFEQISGDSAAIRLAVGRAQRAALRDVPVLILGESGTGKERFAQAIHAASHRGGKGKPFLALNCAAISRELLESELFGHKRGAFTGAVEDRAGLFEVADGGTLFLDEIGECDPTLQAKLLRVLQPPAGGGPCRRVFQRVGESKERTADVRIIAATNRDLHDAIRRGTFREDLYYRLAVITIKLPALRARKTDIPLIAHALLGEINEAFRRQDSGYRDKSLSATATDFMRGYAWPGNVRELYNVLLQAAVMAETDTLERADIQAAIAEVPGSRSNAEILEQPLGDGFSLERLLQRVQQHYLRRAMEEAHGVKTRAADLLGMANYQTLDAQLKRFGIAFRRR